MGRVSGHEACIVADAESQADLEESVVLWKANLGSRILQKLDERGTWNQRDVIGKLASFVASLGRVCERDSKERHYPDRKPVPDLRNPACLLVL